MTSDSTRSVQLEWTGEGVKFRGGGTHPITPPIEIDGDNESGPGPMLTLLLATAGCSAADVVVIMEKMRVKLAHLSVEIDGVRREGDPRRYDALHLRYRMRGDGLDDVKADRAVSLSVEKYCSVLHSLAPDIALSYEIDVTGAST